MSAFESIDAELVTEAAAALDTSEIAVFRHAWKAWFGGPADESRIERPFVAYMFGARAPHWVRDYARRVVAENRCGPVQPAAWGARSQYVRNPLLGVVLATIAVTVLVVLVVAADISAKYIAGVETCFTPPCYEQYPVQRPPP